MSIQRQLHIIGGLCVWLMAVHLPVLAQQRIWHIEVFDSTTRQPLPGAVVADTVHREMRITNVAGWVSWPQQGNQPLRLRLSCIGYQTRWVEISSGVVDTLRFALAQLSQQLGEVMISATRILQPVQDIPVHVQVVGPEDIAEGTAALPGNLRELLTELSGTQIQQTSAISGYAGIRLLGLGTAYTQLLKDGFPLYGGLSGSLSMLQIPPLDLQRVEVIKGASSALYGGDAIAGIINLVSRTPQIQPEWTAVLNQTNKSGTDFGSFFSRKGRYLGEQMMVSYSRQQAVDVNGDGFSELPYLRQITLQPELFVYLPDSSQLRITTHVFNERRIGGDMVAILHQPDSIHDILQTSKTTRVDQELSYQKKLGFTTFMAKTSWVAYQRRLNNFWGKQLSTYSEFSDQFGWHHHQTIVGMNVLTDAYHPVDSAIGPAAYQYYTIGIFLQDDWSIGRRWTLESGIRQDWHNRYGGFFLPRLAILYKPIPALHLRGAIGFGYKVPTAFNAQTEELGYTHVAKLSSGIKPVRATSLSVDAYYHWVGNNGWQWNIDQAGYFTRLQDPQIAEQDTSMGELIRLTNAQAPIVSWVSETNLHVRCREIEAYIGYTWVKALRRYDVAHPQLPLTPRGHLVSTLIWHGPKDLEVGWEAFYTGIQYLDSGIPTHRYSRFDAMIEKRFGRFTLLLNAENFTNVQQSHWGPLYTGTITHPQFVEIYAPLDGRVMNISVKWNLLDTSHRRDADD
ncbi:MAG: TonB-dependent receptor [Thermoflavifilum sp.]|nr:TonB-dependent receptor [Thermoflavifilum sp.]